MNIELFFNNIYTQALQNWLQNKTNQFYSLVLLSLFLILLILAPSLIESREYYLKKRNQLKEDVHLLTKKQLHINFIKNNLLKIKEKINELEKKLPSNLDSSDIMFEFNNLFYDDMTLIQQKVISFTKDNDIEHFKIIQNIKGKYYSIIYYINEILNFPYLNIISFLSINNSQITNWDDDPELETEIHISFFRLLVNKNK